MKNIITFIIVMFFLSNLVAQENMLADGVGEFESYKSSGWWLQQKDNIKFIKGKYSEGNSSLKFTRGKNDNDKGNLAAHNSNALKAPLKPGKYKVVAKVWLASDAPSGFNFTLKSKKYQNIGIKFKNTPKKKWVEVSENFEIKRFFDGKLILSVYKDPKFGGKGTFYIDELKIVKI